MHTINHTATTILPAPAHVVWQHLFTELNGTSTWWHPHNTFRPGPTPPDHLGGATHITVHTNGVNKPGPKIHFTATTTHITPDTHYAASHTGHFHGHTTIHLTPHDSTHTHLAYTFTATPHGWPHLLPISKIHANHAAATNTALTNLHRQLTSH